MSFQELILNGINNLQTDGDLRGAFQHIINSSAATGGQSDWHPCIDIVDTKNNLYVDMELAGVVDDSIAVDFCNNKLGISGVKLKRRQTRPLKREILYGRFNRIITLPFCVTSRENVITTFENGVLSIIIDKKKEEEETRFSMGVSRTRQSSSSSNDNNFPEV